MARPKCCRRVSEQPGCRLFKPIGVPLSSIEEIVLSVDEFEAIRLADLEGLYQEQAADRMNISRQTFGRIVQAARRKVAQALAAGLALRIKGGEIELPEQRTFRCGQCEHTWAMPFGSGKPALCPECSGGAVHRFDDQAGTI
jgi:uncharacterized protein